MTDFFFFFLKKKKKKKKAGQRKWRDTEKSKQCSIESDNAAFF